MKIFDTHAHYDTGKLRGSNTLIEAHRNGVEFIANVGTKTSTIVTTMALARKYPFVIPIAGFFPCDTISLELDSLTWDWFVDLCEDNEFRCIGEIGLDYHWNKPSREIQRKWFRKQIELAVRLNLPISIHSREAESDTMAILKEYPEARGVIHCYSYGVETAETLVLMGYYLGIGGTSTYSTAEITRDVIKAIPIENLVTETDAPYLTPYSNRGRVNRSDYLDEVIDNIAYLKNIEINEAAQILFSNALNLFNIEPIEDSAEPIQEDSNDTP